MERDSFYEILYRLTSIPFYVVMNNTEWMTYGVLQFPTKVEELIKANRLQVVRSLEPPKVSRLKDTSNLTYIGFEVRGEHVVLGPFLEQETDLNELHSLKKRLRLIGEDAILLDNSFHQLRVLNSVEINFMYFLIQSLYGERTIAIEYKILRPVAVKQAKQIDPDGLFQEFEFVKRNYEVEEVFMKTIEDGDVDGAKEFLTHEIMSNLPDRAVNDSLRNTKTRLTIMNTLCNRAAIRGGIDVQLGHQISTNFGIQIEGMKSNFDANRFMKDILITYAEAVRDYAIKDYSQLIRNAIFYIRRHITTSVSLHDISDYLFISKEHLSRQFKQETGFTVSQYINNTKIIEAKKLLKQRNQTILDISTMLGFANSSHFSSVFKRIVGVTPKQYQTTHE